MTPAPSDPSFAVVRAVLAAPAALFFVACAVQLTAGLRGGGVREGRPSLAVGGAAPESRGNIGSIIKINDGTENIIALEHHHSHHGSHGHSHSGQSSSQADNSSSGSNAFDFFVYSMSYQPEFCRENGGTFAGCHAPREEWQGQLTIHGLWPSRDDGTWPAACTNERFDPSLLADLSEDLAERWPNIKALSPDTKGHTKFWEHEWAKHGTCSGLSQADYFSTALDLLLLTPTVVQENYGASVRREDLATDPYLGGDMAVFACRNGYLSEVRVCYERMADAAVGERVSCPLATLREDSCGEDIRIASFDASVTTAVE